MALNALPRRFLSKDTCIGLAIALGTFIVYLLTLSPSMSGEEDQPELAAAAYVLGNSHPTGYPLFLLLGRVFSLLPLGDLRVIVKLNLMTALFCAAAVFVFYHLLLQLLRPNALGLKSGAAGPVDATVRTAAAAAALTFAFSKTYWTNALNLEVYGLHLLFLSVVVTLFVRSMRAEIDHGPGAPRVWMLFVYVLGLSFAHHMMTVLLAPAFLWLYFSVHGFRAAAWLKMARGIPLFLLGLSAYLYLPIRAAVKPVLNWGDPASAHNFWLHFSGHQYKAMMFASLDLPFQKLTLFIERFPGVFGYAPLLVAALGLVTLLLRERRLFLFSTLLFLGCLLYAINYDFDDPNFYLNLQFATAVWVGAGLVAALRWFSLRGRKGVTSRTPQIAIIAAFLVPAFPLAVHYRDLDESGNYAHEDFARNVLGPLEHGGVIVTNQSQYLSSVALYLQWVEGYRPDLVVLQESSTGFHSYHVQLRSRYPAFVAQYLQKAEAGGSGALDSAEFVDRYFRTIWTLVDLRDRIPLYFAPDIDIGRYFPNIPTFPKGLVLKAYQHTPPPLTPPQTFHYRPFPKENENVTNIRTYYATAYVNQALIYGNFNDTAAVLDMLTKALAVKPGFAKATSMLRWVRYGY
jgi:hypothetical protein